VFSVQPSPSHCHLLSDSLCDGSLLLYCIVHCIVTRFKLINISQNSNPIWEYFSKVEGNTSKAKCSACDNLSSLGSNKPSKQTVHGLKNHVEKCHKDLYASFTAKLESRRNQVQSRQQKEQRLLKLAWECRLSS